MSTRSILTTIMILACAAAPVKAQKIAIFQCPVEIEHSNDQGDMASGEYLRTYGTKGKTRTLEFLHQVLNPFVEIQLTKAGFEVLALDTLSAIKSNVYGCPNLTIKKAAESGIADQYLRIHIKDIGLTNQANQTDPFSQQRKEVNVRCRLQFYDANRNLVKEAEGFFKSGDPIPHPEEVGVDLRQYRGDPYMQEIKIYETCCKMAILNALSKLK